MTPNPDYVPDTINKAAEALVQALSKDEIEWITKTTPADMHHSLGRYIRNEWSLWEPDTPLANDYQKTFHLFPHADDMSGMIITTAIALLTHTENIEDKQKNLAKVYREHWESMGVNPETGKTNYY